VYVPAVYFLNPASSLAYGYIMALSWHYNAELEGCHFE
jgi:hypothetical protein